MTTTPEQRAEDARQRALHTTRNLLEAAQETLAALETGDLNAMPWSSSMHTWTDLTVEALDRLTWATSELPEA